MSKSPSIWRRHWTGELPLATSFWVMIIFVQIIVLAAVLWLLATWHPIAFLSPTKAFLSLALLSAAVIAIAIWQVVGFWRAARNHGARGGWRRLTAASAMVLGSLASIAYLTTVVVVLSPHVLNTGEASLLGDRFEPAKIEVGAFITLSGQLGFGSAQRFEDALKRAPIEARVVILSSPGGRGIEGQKIGELIYKRSMITYVREECASACVFVFLRGRERWLSEGARLGFHVAHIRWASETVKSRVPIIAKNQLINLGVPDDFAERAINTPHDSIWWPSFAELLDAKLITGIADDQEFAFSGVLLHARSALTPDRSDKGSSTGRTASEARSSH